jgi:hypothetical protein
MELNPPLSELPEVLFNWLIVTRQNMLENLRRKRNVKLLSSHLPVMATWGDGKDYPINLTVKGIGLVPKKDKLEEYTEILENVFEKARTISWEQSLPDRLSAIKKVYENREALDPRYLGGLEIFAGKAYRNLVSNPLCSLLFMGIAVDYRKVRYISFQLNGRVKILKKNNPYYRFLLAARKIFEFEIFHLIQTDYPFGYLLSIDQVLDKSPHPQISALAPGSPQSAEGLRLL